MQRRSAAHRRPRLLRVLTALLALVAVSCGASESVSTTAPPPTDAPPPTTSTTTTTLPPGEDEPPETGPTRAPSPVEGGVSPDLLGTFNFIGDGIIEFAYEGERIVGRVVRPARNTGIDLWGQLSLCQEEPGVTEDTFIGELTFQLDAKGVGRWFFFERVPGEGFQRCVLLDQGAEVSVIFTDGQASATGARPDGATIQHNMPRVEVAPGDVSGAFASVDDPVTDVRDQTSAFSCPTAGGGDLSAAVNITGASYEPRPGTVGDFAPGGALTVTIESLATLPADVMVEYSLIVQFGQFAEQLLGGSDTPGSGTAVGLAEWSWFFPPIGDAGGQVTAAALGAAGEIVDGTALARTGIDAFVVEFGALPAFEDANVFAVDVVATFSVDGEVLNTCSDTVILPGVR